MRKIGLIFLLATILHTQAQNTWYQPPLDSTWQWQLQGELNLEPKVDIYDIDLFDAPDSAFADLKAQGRHILCYFSAGSWEEWRDDAAHFPQEVLGKTLDGWDDERWLNINSRHVRTIMEKRITLAKERGCDGVEPDNVQGYLEATGFAITAEQQLDFNRFLAETAHAQGLAVALKNDIPQLADLVAYVDLAVNEECFEHGECDAYNVFIQAGKPVLNAEYARKYVRRAKVREQLCQEARALGIRSLVLPLDLDGSFRFACE